MNIIILYIKYLVLQRLSFHYFKIPAQETSAKPDKCLEFHKIFFVYPIIIKVHYSKSTLISQLHNDIDANRGAVARPADRLTSPITN